MAISRKYNEEIQNWLKWYNYNRVAAQSGGVEQQLKFLHKANYGAISLLASLTDEFQRMSQKELPSPAERLILPIGARW